MDRISNNEYIESTRTNNALLMSRGNNKNKGASCCCRRPCNSKMFLYVTCMFLLLPHLISQNQLAAHGLLAYWHLEPVDDNAPRLLRVDYGNELTGNKILNMSMGATKQLNMTLKIDRSLLISKIGPQVAEFVGIKFETKTIQPQFEILQLTNEMLVLTRSQLNSSNYVVNTKMQVYADYLGRANIHPSELLLSNKSSFLANDVIRLHLPLETDLLNVIVVQNKGFWDTLFIVTVSLLVIVIYLNLGAQIDLGNMRQIIHRPRSIFLGFLISTLTMPLVAFLVPQLFETRNFLLYRVGFFMFACGPAALASTPWTELMGGDKELSMSLQLLSTVAGFFVMPVLVFLMELAIGQSDYELLREHPLQVPYSRLIELLIILIVSLSIGYYFIGRNPKLRKLTGKIYRPLIFAMLLFIIISSSVIYWHIYRMFDWSITLTAFTIIASTILVSYALALTSTCDRKHALTIAISSIYKNEGIAFTILAFAFDKPDNFVAYVPCLTQILITSLSFCIIRSCIQFGKLCRPRDPNSASGAPELVVSPSQAAPDQRASCCARERDEFIPVNVNVNDEEDEASGGDHADASQLKVQVGGSQQNKSQC